MKAHNANNHHSAQAASGREARMNGIQVPNDPAGVFYAIPMPGVSWAGQNPLGEGFCFGLESGGLVLTDTRGTPQGSPGEADSKEAVNGMAFSKGWPAVTTRADINFFGPALQANQEQVVIAGGGLDVVVAPRSGYFVVSIGPAGIMFVKPGITDKEPLLVSRSDKISLNYSRLLALPDPAGDDLIVSAGRRGGLGFVHFKEGTRRPNLNSVKFHDLDLVDVCSMGGLAVAAVAKDGSLVLFNDILTDRNPQTVKFKGVQGTVYRLLYGGGYLFVLTSKALYGLFGLAAQFLNNTGRRLFYAEILRLPIEASDANVVREKWLLAVGIDCVLRFDLEKMPKSPQEGRRTGQWEEPDDIGAQPFWEESTFEQTSGDMATV
jgi:hypothetical protein